jgi:hypothetical protein
MEFNLIDYSAHYFKQGAPRKISGKFVQIRSQSAEYIVLCPRELARYHANIVERFSLEKSGIRGHYNQKRDNFIIESPEWSVAGGGLWEIDEGARSLTFLGTSLAYGRFDPAGLREKILSLKPGWSVEIA